jgi:hypothetical protein
LAVNRLKAAAFIERPVLDSFLLIIRIRLAADCEMTTHIGRIFYVATCVLAATIVIYATAFLFTPYSWEVFAPEPRFPLILRLTVLAAIVWGLGRTVYHFTRS